MTRQTPHLTLALDTSTKLQAIGLLEDDLILERRVRRVRYNHGSSLLAAVDGLLSAHGKTVADLSLIGVGMGPGSFTGLRVGMATAKGIARAAGVPIQGASTLASFALAPALATGEPVVAAVDAHRGQVYAGVYQWKGGALATLHPDAAWAPEELRVHIEELAQGARPRVLAQSFGRYAPLSDLGDIEGVHVLPERDAHSDPVGLALLAIQAHEAHGPADLHKLEPNYVRPSDAELNFGKKKG